MSLTEDQRAMLQLLLEGGQDYGDLAGLLGISSDDVRSRARAALAEMGAADLDRAAPVSDFLLGQADTPASDAARAHLGSDPEALASARQLSTQLKLIAPGATLPDLPRAAGPATEAAEEAAAPKKEAPAPPQPEPVAVSAVPGSDRPTDGQADASFTRRQKQLLAALVGGALVVLAIVLGVTGVFGDNSEPAADSDTTAASTTPGDEEVTRAILRPLDGGKAQGLAIFGAVDNAPVLQITAEGLEPTGKGEEYTVWLYRNDKMLLRLAGLEVEDDGLVATQIDIPQEALPYIANNTLNKIDISKGRTRDYRQELAAGKKANRLPHHVGTSVLRGKITGPGLGANAQNDDASGSSPDAGNGGASRD